jgi:hypothetical protein
MYQPGLQTIAWKADDPDDDRLSYCRSSAVRAKSLAPLALDRSIRCSSGTPPRPRWPLLIRVIASDATGNAIERALTGSRESEALDIDNTPLQITVAAARQGTTTRLSVDVRDAQSPIQNSYSIAGGPWQLVYPADGLADSPQDITRSSAGRRRSGARGHSGDRSVVERGIRGGRTLRDLS